MVLTLVGEAVTGGSAACCALRLTLMPQPPLLPISLWLTLRLMLPLVVLGPLSVLQ